jgi:hypothetical protein
MDAERAARQIVDAARRGDAEVILSAPAWILARVQGLFPGLTTHVLRWVNDLVLPDAEREDRETASGHDAISRTRSAVLHALTRLGRTAADRFGQRAARRDPSKATLAG